MLTQNDLQAIGKIFDNKFDSRLTGIEERLSSMEVKIDSLETKMGLFEGKLGSLETKFTKKIDYLDKKVDRLDRSINKKLDVVISYFEYRDVNLEKRVNRIEAHLSLTPLNS